MTKARDTANLVATGVPNSLITLDAAEIPNISTDKLTSGTLANARVADLPTSKITSGTFADARISESSVTAHVSATDLQPLKSDLTALALREATNSASAAFNLPSSFIETFTDDTNLGTQTDGDRISGYWTTIAISAFAYETGDRTSTYTITVNGTWDSTPTSGTIINGTTGSGGTTLHNGTTQSAGTYIRFDRGSGNTFIAGGLKMIRQNSNTQNGGSDWKWQGSQDAGSWTDLGTGLTWGGANPVVHTWTNTTGYRYYQLIQPDEFTSNNDTYEYEWQFSIATGSASATGTLIQTANAVTGSRTKVGGTILYADTSGTNALGTDLKIYFTCNGGTNWTEAAGYNAITPLYSSGIKQVRLSETTCTSGTDVRYKAVWANQASGSKEARLHGIGINY